MKPMNLISSKVFFYHITGRSCPETPGRLKKLPKEWFKNEGIGNYREYEHLLEYAHDIDYIKYVKERCRRIKKDSAEYVYPNEETFLSKDTYKVACFAAGYSVESLLSSLDGNPTFAVVRPPGHHAERSYGKGFCIFNNMAIAALYAVKELEKRIMVIDFDIHRGDGTQRIIAEEEKISHISINQNRIYPDDEVVEIPPSRNIMNIYLPMGSSEDMCLETISKKLQELTDGFKPDIIGFSAGFDSCYLDRGWLLASDFRMGERYFRSLREFAENRNVPHFAVLEGGYNPESVLFGIKAFAGIGL